MGPLQELTSYNRPARASPAPRRTHLLAFILYHLTTGCNPSIKGVALLRRFALRVYASLHGRVRQKNRTRWLITSQEVFLGELALLDEQREPTIRSITSRGQWRLSVLVKTTKRVYPCKAVRIHLVLHIFFFARLATTHIIHQVPEPFRSAAVLGLRERSQRVFRHK